MITVTHRAPLTHRLLRRLAIRTKHPCPRCQHPITKTDTWGIYREDIWHGECLVTHLSSRL